MVATFILYILSNLRYMFHPVIYLYFYSFGKVLLAQLRESNSFYALKALRKDVVLQAGEPKIVLILFLI